LVLVAVEVRQPLAILLLLILGMVVQEQPLQFLVRP
jgi:hypothetical protein